MSDIPHSDADAPVLTGEQALEVLARLTQTAPGKVADAVKVALGLDEFTLEAEMKWDEGK